MDVKLMMMMIDDVNEFVSGKIGYLKTDFSKLMK